MIIYLSLKNYIHIYVFQVLLKLTDVFVTDGLQYFPLLHVYYDDTLIR